MEDIVTTLTITTELGTLTVEKCNGWVTIVKVGDTPESGGGNLILSESEAAKLREMVGLAGVLS